MPECERSKVRCLGLAFRVYRTAYARIVRRLCPLLTSHPRFGNFNVNNPRAHTGCIIRVLSVSASDHRCHRVYASSFPLHGDMQTLQARRLGLLLLFLAEISTSSTILTVSGSFLDRNSLNSVSIYVPAFPSGESSLERVLGFEEEQQSYSGRNKKTSVVFTEEEFSSVFFLKFGSLIVVLWFYWSPSYYSRSTEV